MTVPFVILSTQRSGSTWMVEMLNSHPRIRARGELFLEGGRGRPRRGAQDLVFWHTHCALTGSGSPGNGDRLQAYLDEVWPQTLDLDAAGFKLMYGQAGAHPALVESLMCRVVRIIHLVRRNALDAIISANAAVVRDQFSAESRADVRDVRVHVNTGELRQRLLGAKRAMLKGRALIARLGLDSIEVAYEELLKDPGHFLEIIRFLGADASAPLSSPMVKLNVKPREHLIANIDKVRATLRETEFEWMLE